VNIFRIISVGLAIIHALESVAAGEAATVPLSFKGRTYLLTVQLVPAGARLSVNLSRE